MSIASCPVLGVSHNANFEFCHTAFELCNTSCESCHAAFQHSHATFEFCHAAFEYCRIALGFYQLFDGILLLMVLRCVRRSNNDNQQQQQQQQRRRQRGARQLQRQPGATCPSSDQYGSLPLVASPTKQPVGASSSSIAQTRQQGGQVQGADQKSRQVGLLASNHFLEVR